VDVHHLDRIFKPQRIALLGATENPKSVSGTVLRNLIGSGFRGVVYPINPAREAVLGVPCAPSVGALPHPPDLAVICSPAAAVAAAVRECGQAGVRGVIVISAGFRETGEPGRLLEEQVAAEARAFAGMRIVGPNCLGVIVPHLSLNISFAAGLPKPGHVAFVSQSGALCASVLDRAVDEGIGFSHFVSIGNMLDVDFADLIDYFGEDELTEAIVLYIESLRNARAFMTAARAFARTKPIVAYKAGRFPESARAAASHTGAMASEDAIFEAAFERAGIVRVYEIGDIFNATSLVARHRTPAGDRLCIVTNAGGPGVMATDALLDRHGTLAELSEQTIAKLDEALPSAWSHGNPVDVLGDANSKRYAKATEIVLGDLGVDAVLAILTPQAMTNPTATAKELAALSANKTKPTLAAWLGGKSVREGLALLKASGVPAYATPEEAVRAFMTLVSYARNLATLYETPRDIPVTFTPDRVEVRRQFDALLPGERTTLSEGASKTLLAAYGIPVARPETARTVEEAVRAAQKVGYPVVLKVASPDITHKTDVGGVLLDIADDRGVANGFDRIVRSVQARLPAARLEGVTVQPMIRSAEGLELIVGAKRDPLFGTVILAGLGGIAAEVLADHALGLPPLNERLARRMLESLRCWPLLRGYRGRPAVHIDLLIEVLMRMSYLVADYPELVELDVNPLLVTPERVVALDARAVVDRAPLIKPGRPYAHLALRPYPEEYVGSATLADGTSLVLRPIKPEDEPLWRALLAGCSKETIYARFRYMFQWSSPEAARRYCFTDYDREVAIVAEHTDGGARKLVGVGRLIADPDGETVEYAVLVADAHQNRGLGGVLTDYCLDIARRWGIRRVVAETTSDNVRMLALFAKRGFDATTDEHGDVRVSKELAPV